MRLDVCRCFFGRSLSDARIASMTPVNSSSFGRNGAFVRTYPGGTENFSIFETVLALMPICRRTLADPLDQNCMPDPCVKLHSLHSPAPCRLRHRAQTAAVSLRPDRTNRPLQ